MSDGPRPRQVWDAKGLAFYGAVLGFLVGIGHAYVHAFWSQPHGENEIEHILLRIVIFVGAGAVSSAAIAMIRNWLIRKQ